MGLRGGEGRRDGRGEGRWVGGGYGSRSLAHRSSRPHHVLFAAPPLAACPRPPQPLPAPRTGAAARLRASGPDQIRVRSSRASGCSGRARRAATAGCHCFSAPRIDSRLLIQPPADTRILIRMISLYPYLGCGPASPRRRASAAGRASPHLVHVARLHLAVRQRPQHKHHGPVRRQRRDVLVDLDQPAQPRRPDPAAAVSAAREPDFRNMRSSVRARSCP